MRTKFLAIALALMVGNFYSQALVSQVVHDPQTVFAYQGKSILTQQAIDAAFSRIPETYRLAFIRDREKINMLTGTLMLNKILAAEAYKSKLDQDPLIQGRLQLAKEQELAIAWKDYMLEFAPEADYEALAYESYLADKDTFRTEVILDISHILLKAEKRSVEEAAKLAEQLKVQLDVEPRIFDALIMEYSQDPGKLANGGRYRDMKRGQMAPSFERAAFSMTTPGLG